MSSIQTRVLRLYIRFCIMIVFSITMAGFVCPILLSAKDSFLNVVGVLLFLTLPPIVGWFGWHAWIHFEQTKEKPDAKLGKR